MCVSAGGKAGLTEGVITAGSGRGFVVESVGERLVVTAPHCLPFLPPAGTLRNPVNFWVPGRLLSLDGRRWFSCTIRHLGGPLWITHAAEGIRNEMSGSPIVSEIGTTIGVVCTAAALWEGGTNPRLTHNLTGWLLRDTLQFYPTSAGFSRRPGRRRVEVGPFASFCFENYDAMRQQMREMLHVDKAVAEVNAGFDYRNHAHMVLSEQMSAGFSEDFAQIRTMGESAAERCEEAEQLLSERRRVLGEEHPETLTAMLDLADCLWAQGRLIGARKLEEQVVAGRRHRLGAKHAHTLKAVGKLAVTMAAQGDLAEARRLQEYVLSEMRELYGDVGLETLRAINNLAGTVSAQGDFDAARELLETVVATSSREFGEQHADSLTAMGNLAAVLWQQGDRGEAYALQQHVVDTLRSVRGEGHQATGAAAQVLEMMERDAGF